MGTQWGLWGGDVQVRYLVVDEILLGLEWGLGRGLWGCTSEVPGC